ncbi:MAG: hypothetical protein HC895_01550 [Leptolyngbyaceae cyanobacterium SM1_3_5]|nr:hypothetical protein [Leptolyngbyaceae cyanobacterium SM1_3_5]
MSIHSSQAHLLQDSEAQAQLIAYLRAQAAKIAGISADQVSIQQPLSDLGFDSLMAVELRNQLVTDWSADVPLQVILEGSSIASLTDRIQEQFAASAEIKFTELPISKSEPTTHRYPLSQGQWGLWFLHKLAPASAAYNVAFTTRIRSQLNLAALKQSLQTLIDRHPTLRTIYGQAEGELFQEILPTQSLNFEQIDAAIWNEETLIQQAIVVYQRPFNLESSVLRVSLLTRSPQDHVLILNIHHIAIDGVSFGVLLNELKLLYEAKITGQSVSLPAIYHQYIDFAQWQREMISGAEGEQLWSYWKQQLEGVSSLILPTDRPRLPIQNQSGSSYSFELSEALTAQLRVLAKNQKTTLYTVLLAAFQVLLHRYTGQEDIVIGTPASGRSQTAFAQTVGFFVNMIALRTNLAGNPTFVELLIQVRSTVLEAIAHQSYSAPLLVERLGMNRDLSSPGLFRASFNLLNLPKMASDFELSISSRSSSQWGDLQLEPFEIPQQEGQNDLVFDVMETSDRLVGILRFSTDLFDAATIHGMAERFQTLLTGIVADPAQLIQQLPILTDFDQQLLRSWGSPKTDYPNDLCIHQLFEAQAEQTPDAIAVIRNEEFSTYQNSTIDPISLLVIYKS